MADTSSEPTLDRVYEYLMDEEDARVCRDIPDEACEVVPGNFFRIINTYTITKLADELANAKTVLPWLLGAVGAPAFWVGLLVPVRESMSMLPQLVIASAVRRQPRRKHTYVVGAVLQGICLGLMAAAALFLEGSAAGAAIVGLLLLFSLARGLCSVASKDVVGKTIPKTRRGRLSGFADTLAGFLTVGVGVLLIPRIGSDAPVELFALLLVTGAGLWLLAAGLFGSVREMPGATEGGGNALQEAIRRLALLRSDRPFRRFVISRALMISTALAGPYYVLLAQQSGGGGLLGVFIIASGLASAVSSAVWGRFSDRSSRLVMVAAAFMASALGLLVFTLHRLEVFDGGLAWAAAAAFFVLSIAHAGVRVGRKTYIVDLAGGEKRADYVAVSNTVIGALLLASGLFGSLSGVLDPAAMLAVLALFSLAGGVMGLALPEVE